MLDMVMSQRYSTLYRGISGTDGQNPQTQWGFLAPRTTGGSLASLPLGARVCQFPLPMPSHVTLPRWAIGIKYTSRGTPHAWPSQQSLQTLQLRQHQHPSVVRRAVGHLDRSNHFMRLHKNPVGLATPQAALT